MRFISDPLPSVTHHTLPALYTPSCGPCWQDTGLFNPLLLHAPQRDLALNSQAEDAGNCLQAVRQQQPPTSRPLGLASLPKNPSPALSTRGAGVTHWPLKTLQPAALLIRAVTPAAQGMLSAHPSEDSGGGNSPQSLKLQSQRSSSFVASSSLSPLPTLHI